MTEHLLPIGMILLGCLGIPLALIWSDDSRVCHHRWRYDLFCDWHVCERCGKTRVRGEEER